jgi:hypothetical protein
MNDERGVSVQANVFKLTGPGILRQQFRCELPLRIRERRGLVLWSSLVNVLKGSRMRLKRFHIRADKAEIHFDEVQFSR